jgi:hypothetical protein
VNKSHTRVTVIIPHLNTLECVDTLIALYQLQTLVPYIVLIDTGSPLAVCRELEARRKENVEIHYLRANSWCHASEPVTAALDLALSMCATEYMLYTHTDAFPRRRDLVEFLARECSEKVPIVGYELSPRPDPEWRGCFGHTCTMMHTKSIFKINGIWSMRKTFVETPNIPLVAGWPDTETAMNRIVKAAKLPVKFLGQDGNFERLCDANIDHSRSYTLCKSANVWHNNTYERFEVALREAKERVIEWSKP